MLNSHSVDQISEHEVGFRSHLAFSPLQMDCVLDTWTWLASCFWAALITALLARKGETR